MKKLLLLLCSVCLFARPALAEEAAPEAPTAAIELPAIDPETQAMIEELVALINVEREKAGVAPFSADNAALNLAAQKRAEEMLQKFDHKRPNGDKYTTVFAEFGIDIATLDNWGEDVAQNVKADTPEAVMAMWRKSSQHYKNLIGEMYDSVGIGHVYGQGQKGPEQHFWVVLFTHELIPWEVRNAK